MLQVAPSYNDAYFLKEIVDGVAYNYFQILAKTVDGT